MNLRNYIYSHCVHPVSMYVYDPYYNGHVLRELPCGKCLHCKNTHINEWVTRLVAQRKYSKYCYYVSLDYAPFEISDPTALQLARETAACYHNINKNRTYGMHPLVLCKNHLQDFYKRLRRNTGIKLQYFACGEYGMHAEGKGYGRPHFHNIIFSNTPISPAMFDAAWTINGYKIGRVDIQDMTNLGVGDKDSIKVFKYVCKYLQKADFDFEKLATINFHRTYFKSLYLVAKQSDLFDTEYVSQGLSSEEYAWREYIKQYSPFVVCSRRPSIGSAYLEENLERFKTKDFRLFGLPSICTSFPRYYVRRTKEALYPYSCIGEDSDAPSSASRMGSIFQVLDELYNSRLDITTWKENATSSWCICNSDKGLKGINLNGVFHSFRSLSFYDNKNRFLYQFDGYYYKIWAKLKNATYVLFDTMDIYDVLREFAPSWDRYYHDYISPMHDIQVCRESDLIDAITALYPSKNLEKSLDKFRKDVYYHYQQELDTNYKTKLLMSNSKQTL